MRLFIDQNLRIGEELAFDGDVFNYIARVLRLKVDDTIVLFNGQKPLGEYLAKIIQLTKKQLIVQLLEFESKDTESPIHIKLLQGISRGDRMDYTIQKSIELGVNEIYPLLLARSNSKLGDKKRRDKKLAHWQGVSNSAIQQSGRVTAVIINEPDNISAIETIGLQLNDLQLKLLPDPTANFSLSDLKDQSTPSSISILIGPEGGITDDERAYAKTQGYLPIRLGPRILRTETAGLAIISYIQGLWGDF